MSKERNNIAVDIYNFDHQKYRPFTQTKLFDVTNSKELWIVFDDDGNILHEKLYDSPKSKSGESRRRNTISRLGRTIADKKGISRNSIMKMDSYDKSTFDSKLDTYFRLQGLTNLYNEYRKRKVDEADVDFKKNYPLDYRLKEGLTYYLYIPTRGDKSEPKSYLAKTFDGLQKTADGADYLFSGHSKINRIKHSQMHDYFKDKKIMTDADYMGWIVDTGYSSPKEMHNSDQLRKLKEVVDAYESNKSKENRAALEVYLQSFVQKVKDRVVFDNDDSLLTPFMKANLKLPYSARLATFALFIPSAIAEDDAYFSAYIEPQKMLKPVWDYIPPSGKKKIFEKAKTIDLNPLDRNLNAVAEMFVSRDELRPTMTGMNFDEYGVTVTDAHRLLHIKGKPNEQGIFRTSKSIRKEYDRLKDSTKDMIDFKSFQKEWNKIDGKYPNWKSVIPSGRLSAKVNLPFFASVLNTLHQNVLINTVTNQVRLLLPDSEDDMDGFMHMGINAVFVIEAVKALMKLGYSEANLFIQTPTRALLLTPPHVESSYGLENETFVLLMPTMLGGDYDSTYSTVRVTDAKTLDVQVGSGDFKEVTLDGFYGKTSKVSPKPKAKPASKENSLKANDVPLHSWVQHKRTKVKAKVWNVDPSLGRFQLEDEWGNQDKTWRSAKDWKITTAPKKDKEDKEKVFLNEKIEAFKMMLDMEDDAKEKQFLKDKIEAFEMMLELTD